MIVGSGLIAKAFFEKYHTKSDACIFASGVSDSSCINSVEFRREKNLLLAVLKEKLSADLFVYFSSCSLQDKSLTNTAYVRHKLEMEDLVKGHPNFFIIRLPQLAGKTKNNSTLLNYLYSCISNGKKFELWRYATRNIIDISDVVDISERMINNKSNRNMTLNIAYMQNSSLIEIVSALEKATNKIAKYNTVNKGSSYKIDTTCMEKYLEPSDNIMSPDYLQNTIYKYYKYGAA